jgi:uncharacterized phage protein (TIGR02218 family)
MKTLSPATIAHLQGETTTLCVCWLIERRDGQVKGFTSNVDDLDVNISGVGTVTFKASSGMSASTLETSVGRGIDNVSALGTINSVDLTEGDLIKGLYDDARVQLLLVNYNDPTQVILLLRGNIGEVKVGRVAFEAEVRSLAQRARQIVGSTCSPLCRVKELGDAECGVNLAAFTFSGQTVSSVVSGAQFRTASAGVVGKPAHYFAYGTLTWTSGDNQGKKVEVRSHDTGSPCLIQMAEVMPYEIQAGDAFTIIAGCDRLAETCRVKFSNILNFRGEPFVPGLDAVLRVISG